MRKENPLLQFKVASYKCLEIRLSFEDPTTLLSSGGRGEGRIGRLRSLEKMPPKYTVFLNSFVQDCSFTEFGEELGDQQRPTLERNDMKLGPLN